MTFLMVQPQNYPNMDIFPTAPSHLRSATIERQLYHTIPYDYARLARSAVGSQRRSYEPLDEFSPVFFILSAMQRSFQEKLREQMRRNFLRVMQSQAVLFRLVDEEESDKPAERPKAFAKKVQTKQIFAEPSTEKSSDKLDNFPIPKSLPIVKRQDQQKLPRIQPARIPPKITTIRKPAPFTVKSIPAKPKALPLRPLQTTTLPSPSKVNASAFASMLPNIEPHKLYTFNVYYYNRAPYSESPISWESAWSEFTSNISKVASVFQKIAPALIIGLRNEPLVVYLFDALHTAEYTLGLAKLANFLFERAYHAASVFLENQSAAACATYQDTAPLRSIFFNSGNGQYNATQLQIQSLAWKMYTDLCTLKKALNNYFVPLTPSHPPKLLELISFYVDRVALPLKNNPEFAKKFNDNLQKTKSMELAQYENATRYFVQNYFPYFQPHLQPAKAEYQSLLTVINGIIRGKDHSYLPTDWERNGFFSRYYN